MLTPANADELSEAIRAHPRVLAVGSQTKPRLSQADATLVSTRALRGIVEYDPGEFTFTALAGTPLREIVTALAEKGQYLPFDPPFVESGATIGGTIAAGLSGPGRFRYGSARDFILAVRFADGEGRLLRGGAKVVKNAAGFDVPKFFTGSLGRYGVLVELTFKVFPRPAALLTVRVPCASVREAVERLAAGGSARWELDALEYLPGEQALYARLGGPAEANAALGSEIARTWPGTEILPEDAAAIWWTDLGEFRWAAKAAVLTKVPVTLGRIPALLEALAQIPHHTTQIGAGGNVAYVALADPQTVPALNDSLAALTLGGLVLRGENVPMRLGAHTRMAIEESVRQVFDPSARFPA